MPESARWLNLKGRTEEVREILQRIALVNKKKLPDDVEIVSMKLDASIGMKHFLNLFTPKKIAVRSLIQGYAWYELYLVFEDSKSYSILDFLQARSLFVCLPKALCTGCSKNLCAI